MEASQTASGAGDSLENQDKSPLVNMLVLINQRWICAFWREMERCGERERRKKGSNIKAIKERRYDPRGEDTLMFTSATRGQLTALVINLCLCIVEPNTRISIK